MAGKLYRYHELYTYPTPMNPYKSNDESLCPSFPPPPLSFLYLSFFIHRQRKKQKMKGKKKIEMT